MFNPFLHQLLHLTALAVHGSEMEIEYIKMLTNLGTSGEEVTK